MVCEIIYTINYNDMLYDIHTCDVHGQYTLIKIHNRKNDSRELCARIWNDVKHLHNDIYNISSADVSSLQHNITLLFTFLKSQYIDMCIPYFHITQHVNESFFTDTSLLEEEFNAVPAFIPLHEYQMKIKMFIEKCSNNESNDMDTNIDLYRKTVSHLLYIVWSIDINSISNIDTNHIQLLDKQFLTIPQENETNTKSELEIIPEENSTILSEY